MKVLGVSKSGYYRWKKQPQSKRSQENQFLLGKIQAIFHQGRKKYGSPRITHRLRQMGHKVSQKRVARLMKKNGIVAKRRKKFVNTTDSKHGLPIAENLLNRQFQVDSPNEVWAGDITYVATKQGWLYLCVVLDLYSRKVIGWSMRQDLTTPLVTDALEMALQRRKPTGALMFHSDRGVQYASDLFRKQLVCHNIVQSMSRKGNCWDNAVVESFFGSLKEEVCAKVFENQDEAKSALFEYIEVFYNRIRLHSTLGYISPEQFEQQCVA